MQTSAERTQTGRVPEDDAFAFWSGLMRVLRKLVLATATNVERGHSRHQAELPDLERALVNPAAVSSTPWAVFNNPRMVIGCKLEILRRWAWDEYLKEVAVSEGMAKGEPSCLDKVKAALLSLDVVWRPKPSAPAAAVPTLQRNLKLVAA